MKRLLFVIWITGLIIAFIISSCVPADQTGQSDLLTRTAVSDMETSIVIIETRIAELQTAVSACGNNDCNVRVTPENVTESVATSDTQAAVAAKDFYCLAGPTDNAEILYTVLKDTKLQLVGRDKSNSWLFISDPVRNASCWVQIKNLKFDSNVSSLPIHTPSSYLLQPSPTPRKQEYSTPEVSYPNP